jgi:hypothetical protein
MFRATQGQNLQLAKEKRDAELRQRENWTNLEAHEVDFTLTNDFMTENPATEQSMLAPHRVKPNHFKGLNDEQQAAILHERDQQVVEQSLLKKQREEEERLWALQLEHNRRLQVINDHDLKR